MQLASSAKRVAVLGIKTEDKVSIGGLLLKRAMLGMRNVPADYKSAAAHSIQQNTVQQHRMQNSTPILPGKWCPLPGEDGISFCDGRDAAALSTVHLSGTNNCSTWLLLSMSCRPSNRPSMCRSTCSQLVWRLSQSQCSSQTPHTSWVSPSIAECRMYQVSRPRARRSCEGAKYVTSGAGSGL